MKKHLGFILILALCVSLLSVGAAAADEPDESITDIPEGLVIEGTVVTDYTGSASELTIPNGVTEIGRSAFNGDKTLESVTFPDSVTTIGQFAFSDAEKLTSITMPGVTTIDNYAFQRIETLESIEMPEVITIGEDAFRGDSALATVTAPKLETIGKQAFNGTAITSIELPEVLNIGERAFYVTPMTSIEAPKVTSIGTMAFASTAFTSFTVPDTVTSIGESILNSCSNLKSLSISLDVLLSAEFDDGAFLNTFNTHDEYEIILTGVDRDVTLLSNGIKCGEKTVTFTKGGLYDVVFHITCVDGATGGTVTNNTGETVTVNNTQVVNGSVKPVGVENDAYLSELALEGAVLEPAFNNQTESYTSFVDYTVETIRVQAIPSDTDAAVTVNGTAANAENDYIVTVPLQEGENTITAAVTTADGTTTKNYTITLTKKAEPMDLVITTAQELMDFAEAVNNGDYAGIADVTVELGGDIDMSGYSWTPIGIDGNNYFSGTFDGNGYTISNLTITKNTTGYFGLFGITNATIQNVELTGSLTNTISDAKYSYVGAVAGYIIGGEIRNVNTHDFMIQSSSADIPLGLAVGGIVGVAESTPVENCVSGTDITLNFSYCFIGGVAGAAVESQITNCIYTGTLTLSGSGYTDCGGIVGNSQQGSAISHCVNKGTIDTTGRTSSTNGQIGGIAGRLDSDSGTVVSCTNEGSVKGKASNMGGIAGYAGGGSIENCLNKGDIESTDGSNTGGIAGGSSVTIKTSVSAGKVSASNGTSDPIAASENGTFVNNYYDEDLFSGVTTEKGTAADIHSQEFVDTINGLGGNYRLGEDGKIEVVPMSYTLTVVGSESATTGAGSYEAGAEVLIDAGAKEGYRFVGWTSDAGEFANAAAARTVFTMPGEDVTVTANWQEDPPFVNIPDTYDIDLIVGEGGDAKTSLTNASAGSTIAVTVTPDEGYEMDYITVDGERIDGTTFTMPAHDVTVRVYFTNGTDMLPFTDVNIGDWYYDAVSYVYANGLMDGVSSTTFAPDANMTRAMLVTILWRMEGEPVVNYLLPFTDVDGGAWYAEAVRWASSEGIVTGVSDTSFAPNAEITREQLATILHRYAGETATAANLAGYADGASVSAYAVDAMSWCVEHGIITGTTVTTLEPQGTATRAQAAAMLMRFAENLK